MARVTGGVVTRRRHKRILKRARGARGRRSKNFRTAKQVVMRAEATATAHRRRRKRDFRTLWIQRINAASRLRGMTYAALIDGLTKAKVDLNRKQLSEIAIDDPAAFDAIVDLARTASSN